MAMEASIDGVGYECSAWAASFRSCAFAHHVVE